MDTLGQGDIAAIVTRIAAIMTEKKEELIRLDGAMGDGDLGLTMEKAFVTAREEAAKPEADLGKLLMRIGMSMARAAPSTMGTLVATGFMSGGKALGGKSSLSLGDMAAFFDAFVAGIMQRGKSKPGEKTIVDVLHPAAQALREAAASGAGMQAAFGSFQAAAREGLEKTRDMIAQHGRVAYYQEQSRGREDPGAVAGTYIVQGFTAHITGASEA
jgi:phosphoenolpyruvate---glycerone phosphotransferase subunit DhaL